MNSHTIAVIGAGAVGTTTAYTLLMKNIASKILLVDINEKKVDGEVLDLEDALQFSSSGSIVRGSYADARNADIIILTAGVGRKPDQSRFDLLKDNRIIIESIFKNLKKIKSSTIIIVVSNPVDVITYWAQELSGLPKNQVFGTGTGLDTARLHIEVAKKLNVHPRSIAGYVLGEHGDSGFIAWSTVHAAGLLVSKHIDAKGRKEIEDKVRTKAFEIIHRKGATFYGIAGVAANIVEAIIHDQRRIFMVGPRVDKWNGVSGVCIGVPAVIGKNGIESLCEMGLPSIEKKKFLASAATLKKYDLK
jgi:L-lactate dehydrogenase